MSQFQSIGPICWICGLLTVGSALAEESASEIPEAPAVLANAPAAVDVNATPEAAADAQSEPDAGALFKLVQDAQVEPLPPVEQPFQPEVTAPEQSARLAASIFGPRGVDRSLLSQARQARAQALTADVVLGVESEFRATTDAGNLLRKSTSVMGVTGHQRAPIVTETRVRGNRVGQFNASGSYWFPARADIDTALSKIDSRIVSDMIVIKGPYSARYGPAFSFIDVEFLPTPRYECGYETHGSTSLEYKTNGEQWYGRQAVWGGDEDYGYRVSYGHRTGSDYEAGHGEKFIGSYNSRDFDGALGFDLTADSRIEFNYLRLDQTNVELANQFLDIDFLVTNSYEVTYIVENQEYFDIFTAEGWYNETRLRGNANSPGKRAQIPALDFPVGPPFPPGTTTNLRANSRSENMSTGFSFSAGWGQLGESQTVVGLDLRYLRQQIDQIIPGDAIGAPPPGIPFNMPLPQAYSSNPGIFIEHIQPVTCELSLTGGGRVDLVDTNAAEDAPLVFTHGFPPLDTMDVTFDLEESLGGGQFNRSFTLGSAFLTAEYQLDCNWLARAGAAYAMRAPTMTELYSLGTFVTAFPQFTLSSLVGNPRLKSEKRYQIDLGLQADYGDVRGGVDGYYAWIEDYITWDRIVPQGFYFAYTNTDLATIAGFDMYGEYDVNHYVMGFATVSYIEGRDHTRDVNAIPASRYRDPNSPRSGVTSEKEPLPMMLPLESRVGVRLHQPSPTPEWGVELSSRIVARQDRVATSLGELQTGTFSVFDLRGFWQATRSLTLIAGVENFTDESYQEHFDSHAQNVATPIPANLGAGVLDLGPTRDVFRPGVNFYFASELTY